MLFLHLKKLSVAVQIVNYPRQALVTSMGAQLEQIFCDKKILSGTNCCMSRNWGHLLGNSLVHNDGKSGINRVVLGQHGGSRSNQVGYLDIRFQHAHASS